MGVGVVCDEVVVDVLMLGCICLGCMWLLFCWFWSRCWCCLGLGRYSSRTSNHLLKLCFLFTTRAWFPAAVWTVHFMAVPLSL